MSLTEKDLEKLLNDLWKADINKCIPKIDYSLNLQGRLKGTRTGKDLAKNNLFNMFDETKVFSRPTYKLFKSLLDNYNMLTGVEEQETKEEVRETDDFLNAIIKTPVITLLHKYLSEKKIVSPELNLFKKELHRIWFEMYRRSNVRDSCGFEHVFVGELRDNQILGLHNWIQIYLQEKAGNIDYKGFFEIGTSNESESPRVITIQFTWRDGSTKPLGSSFVGTSPEFEIAFFTAIHLCKPERDVRVQVDRYHMDLIHHRIANNKIGTSYIKGLD